MVQLCLLADNCRLPVRQFCLTELSAWDSELLLSLKQPFIHSISSVYLLISITCTDVVH